MKPTQDQINAWTISGNLYKAFTDAYQAGAADALAKLRDGGVMPPSESVIKYAQSISDWQLASNEMIQVRFDEMKSAESELAKAILDYGDRRAAAAVHRVRVHLANQYHYSHREFCEKLAEIISEMKEQM